MIDRSKYPAADQDYPLAQRRLKNTPQFGTLDENVEDLPICHLRNGLGGCEVFGARTWVTAC